MEKQEIITVYIVLSMCASLSSMTSLLMNTA